MTPAPEDRPWYQRLSGVAASLRCSPAEVLALALLGLAAVAGLGLLWVSSEQGGVADDTTTATPDELGVVVEGGSDPVASSADGTGVASDAPSPVEVQPPEAIGPVVVHVAGAVNRPGLYELPPGSRAGEAVDAAGGFAADAAPTTLNLARPVADGEQLVVLDRAQAEELGPLPAVVEPSGAPGVPGVQAASSEPTVLDINQASAEELETLPGVGPVLAGRIVEHRSTVGPFTEIGALRDVTGIGEKTFQALAPLVRV